MAPLPKVKLSDAHKIFDARFIEYMDQYTRIGAKVSGNSARAGKLAMTSVVANAALHVQHLPPLSPGPDSPPVEPGLAVSALLAVASGMETVVGWEQQLTSPLRHIPFPGFPALHVLALDYGFAHAHNHPPNLVPPNPIPMPLPSMGPVVPIPILSGAMRTLVGGLQAARCGDMGIGAWCGSTFPMYEIFLGSATVWCESARAGRMTVDVTNHCIFSAPQPTDPPLGPMVGTTGMGVLNIRIGGVPTPSLFSLAIAGLFKAAARGGKAVYHRLTAKKYVENLIDTGIIHLHDSPHAQGAYAGWRADMIADLETIAATRTGRELLDQLRRTAHGEGFTGVHIYPMEGIERAAAQERVQVWHSPRLWPNHSGPQGKLGDHTPSDDALFHELTHASHYFAGTHAKADKVRGFDWPTRWEDFEEYSTVAAENRYRAEQGHPIRKDYRDLP